jgi:hypothetical protein
MTRAKIREIIESVRFLVNRASIIFLSFSPPLTTDH